MGTRTVLAGLSARTDLEEAAEASAHLHAAVSPSALGSVVPAAGLAGDGPTQGYPMDAIPILHAFFHRLAGIDYPFGHWWIDLAVAVALVLGPAWAAWMAGRLAFRWPGPGRSSGRMPPGFATRRTGSAAPPHPRRPAVRTTLETFVLRATLRQQVRLVAISVLTLPMAWMLLEIPKHIINHALSDPGGRGLPGMSLPGLDVDRTGLLFALCAGYLGVLSLNGLIKYGASRIRGRVNERIVRRLRLSILREARDERSEERRATFAAVAIQEVEAIGYFGGGLVAVPIVQGGVFVTSVVFLLLQNPALAAAALVMLPLQLTVLPRLQRRLNAKVRQRVHATRALGALLAGAGRGRPSESGGVGEREWTDRARLAPQMRQAEDLERMRVEIGDLKGRLKGLYNYSSNLTPFFLFLVGGYLVVQGKLSLGALVAALTAYKEIAPALRELFDFAQAWSDARARFEEVSKVLGFADAVEPGRRSGGAEPAPDISRGRIVEA